MIYKTKNHVNIVNLISKCERQFQADSKPDWRLDQYIKAIFYMLEQEENQAGKLNDELNAAKKKTLFLQGLIEAQSKGTLLEQYTAINLLSSDPTIIDNKTLSQTRKIHLNELANYDKKIQKKLFYKNKSHHESKKNFDDIIKYHQLLQDQVTSEMLELVEHLKQNCAISNEIVKKDTELLERTNHCTEKTVSNLRKNTEKIKEFANMACEYWLWISLFIVCFSFLFMVIFIRLFPIK